MLLGALMEDYRALYENAINTAKEHNPFCLFEPSEPQYVWMMGLYFLDQEALRRR